jgi:Type IV pili methyl-accepting chemotaxis transducer N-term
MFLLVSYLYNKICVALEQRKIMINANRRKWVIGTALSGVLPWVGAQLANATEAVNLSGRQRMLSARTAKAYCQLGRGIDVPTSQKLLRDSVSQFDVALSQLRVFAPTAEIKASFKTLSEKWADYKDLIVGTAPAKERVAQVLSGSDELVALANTATAQLEKQSGRATSRLTNMCGRQRMLTQQIAAYSFARNWALPAAQTQPIITKNQKEYLEALTTLKTAPQTTPDIKRMLDSTGAMWVFFETAFNDVQGVRTRSLDDLSTASELILLAYDDLSLAYSRLV